MKFKKFNKIIILIEEQSKNTKCDRFDTNAIMKPKTIIKTEKKDQ